MIVKLLVLVALAFSLGMPRDASAAIDDRATQSMISLLESEPEPPTDVVVVEPAIARALPRVVGVNAIVHRPLICSWDPSGVFRPPRLVA